MKLSDLIKQARKAYETHGDIEVMVNDEGGELVPADSFVKGTYEVDGKQYSELHLCGPVALKGYRK